MSLNPATGQNQDNVPSTAPVRTKRIIIQHNSHGTTLPSNQQLDYSSSGLSGTDEDEIFFDSESYLSGDHAGIDRNSTVLRGGRRLKNSLHSSGLNVGSETISGTSNTTDNIPISNASSNDIESTSAHYSYPPMTGTDVAGTTTHIGVSNELNKKKKLRKKNLQYQQDKFLKTSFKEFKDSHGFYGGILSEEDYKSLFVIPHEEIFTTEHFRTVIEPALREYEDTQSLHHKQQKPYKALSVKERYHKLVDKQAKEALQRQYDVEFISLLEDILVPFINQRKAESNIEEESENKESLVERLKGNFMVLALTDSHRRFLTHAVCQFYGLKSFSTDFDSQRVTVISKRRHLVETDQYPIYETTKDLLSTYLAQSKPEKPSYMIGNDLFKHEGNEITVLDKKSFVKHYRKKKQHE
ncbi:hypothetical protein C9374_004418 [Naegleria lovaniensis]|uniref:R3H domain-containing protein n=1 Tax=Naegleria lovaniensis TaxID=51637 RepID=A0AA88GPV0_NAELO|nr:uncharacterized protein C9374_004418 [Naegleria lovaniensis]KAG2383081.1 hypothetical protein C9374_004418 [Naegleria lovaniensis]